MEPTYTAPASRLLRSDLTQREKLEHLQDLIAWMRTRDPGETYDYWNISDCLLVRYMRARGVPLQDQFGSNYPAVSAAVLSERGFLSHRKLGVGSPWTVTDALAGAEATLSALQGQPRPYRGPA